MDEKINIAVGTDIPYGNDIISLLSKILNWDKVAFVLCFYSDEDSRMIEFGMINNLADQYVKDGQAFLKKLKHRKTDYLALIDYRAPLPLEIKKEFAGKIFTFGSVAEAQENLFDSLKNLPKGR